MLMLAKIKEIQRNLSPNFRKIIGNSFWLMADNFLRLGIGLIVGIWVARYLGPKQFGILNYAIAFAGMFGVFAKAGLDSIVIRDLVRYPESKDEILGTTFAVKLFCGYCAFLLAVGASFLFRTDDPKMPWIIGIISFSMVFQAFDTVDLWFQSQVQSKYVVYSKNAAYILVNIAKVILIKMDAPLIGFVITAFAEIAIGSIGLAVAYRSAKQSFKLWHGSIQLAKKLLRESWPNILAGFSIGIYMRVDQLMLGYMVGDEAVGTYSVGVRLAELWYFLPVAISSSINPRIIQSKQEGEVAYYDRIQRALNFLVAIAYLVAIGLTLFSKDIIYILYGSSYAAASNTLAVYVWAGIFVSLGMVKGIWITTEGLLKFGFITTLLGAMINVILNLLLIPRYSSSGAALATVISYGISDYVILLLYRPSRKIGFAMTKALALDLITSKLHLFRQKS
jgi:polysaccharide transporter, PST family